MRPKGIYLALCAIGTILPVAQFLPFLEAMARTRGCSSRNCSPSR